MTQQNLRNSCAEYDSSLQAQAEVSAEPWQSFRLITAPTPFYLGATRRP
jgi:hypothetical protein